MTISVADALTGLRIVCGVAVAFRPSVALLLAGVVTDWLDGPLARRAAATAHGPAFDLEADSVLTVGAAIAAARLGAPRVVLLAPMARYAVVRLRPRLDPDKARWDRITGVSQMVVLVGAIARWPVGLLALPVSAARSAALAARIAPR
jgi:phosphatidylglycerophosphate synthase